MSGMFTSWLERWRLAKLIPQTTAAGGSDPCTGSIVKYHITSKKASWASFWPDKIGAGRGDRTHIPSFAFSRLPRFIRDESSGAPPLQSVHALGRVKLRQASGVLFMADGYKPVIQSPLSPGILRPAPGLLKIKPRHGPVAGYPPRPLAPLAVLPQGHGQPGQLQDPTFHKYSIDAARPLIPQSIREPRCGRCVGTEKPGLPGLPAQPIHVAN